MIQCFTFLHFLLFIIILFLIGMVDVKNLSELLSQCPDVVDAVGARPIPILSYR
jgi:hypothetical protein